MRPINDYEFHDAEIRYIAFDVDKVSLNIFNPSETEYVRLTLEGVSLFCFETNITQNVIESINILTRDEMNSVNFVSDRLTAHGISVDSINKDVQCVYVVPIAGPDMLVLCTTFHLDTELS